MEGAAALHRESVKRLIKIAVFLLITIVFTASLQALTQSNRDLPQAKRGVLDLSNWSLEQDGPVFLDGEWEFYEGQLLTPADFHQNNSGISYLSVPATWTGKNAEGGMARKGFGTYRLKVLLQDEKEGLGLKTRSIRMAHRLFINGKLESESGQPSSSKKLNIPGNTPSSAFFKQKRGKLSLLFRYPIMCLSPGDR